MNGCHSGRFLGIDLRPSFPSCGSGWPRDSASPPRSRPAGTFPPRCLQARDPLTTSPETTSRGPGTAPPRIHSFQSHPTAENSNATRPWARHPAQACLSPAPLTPPREPPMLSNAAPTSTVHLPRDRSSASETAPCPPLPRHPLSARSTTAHLAPRPLHDRRLARELPTSPAPPLTMTARGTFSATYF